MAAKVPETPANPRFPSSSFKYSPLRHARVTFIRFCQGLFYAAPPGCYHWDADISKTEIVITSENKIDQEAINRRPGISFTRGPVSFYSLGIDDREKYDMALDKKEKGVLVPGTMTINVASRVMQETEDLAWVIAEHIWLLRDLLMKAGFFDIGRTPQIGSPSPAGSVVAGDSGDEFYVTSVSIPWQIARNSSFTPLGISIARSIELSISPRAPQPVASQGPAYHPYEYPLQVQNTAPPSFAPLASDAQGQTPDPACQQESYLSKQPHPLNPSVTVNVRTVRPFRGGLGTGANVKPVPITPTCVEES